jgi:phospholipid/cholesterol/gamma-HCH transport system substrate-binding protein
MTRRSVVILGFLLLASLGGCGRLGDPPLEATAVLKESSGLYVGNDVGVLGVTVGKITKLEPQGETVHVTFEVTDPQVRIPADAAAVVVSRSVATDRYIELTPVYRSGPTMPSGTVIPLARTRTPVDFDEVLTAMSDLSSELVNSPKATNGIREVLQTVAATFAGNSDDLNAAIKGLADLVGTVHGQRTSIFDTMDSLDRLSTGLVDHEDLIQEFVENLSDALDLLNSERSDVEQVLKSVSATVDRVAEFSQENRGAVTSSVDQVLVLLRSILESRPDLGGVLELMPLATDNVGRAADGKGNIWVRTKPAEILGLGPQFEQLCAALGPVCNFATFPQIPGLTGGASS